MNLEFQTKDNILNKIIGILLPGSDCNLPATMIAQKGCSFLFVGENKRQMLDAADELAKYITCSAPDKNSGNANYCNQCINCRMVTHRQHPDVVWIRPRGLAASIKIADIRQLKARIQLKPYQAQKKLFVIEDAERLSQASANALLKTLEEPPADALLILICQSASQLLATVVSRCQLIRFSAACIDTKEQPQEMDKLLAKFFFAEDDFLADSELCKDIVTMDRNTIEQLLENLILVLRDIMINKLDVRNGTLLSRQPQVNIIKWSEVFPGESLPHLLNEALRTKSYIHKNANVKLSIDLLVKTIKSHRRF